MPRKPVLAYAIGGAAAAVAAIVITASTVGLASTNSDVAQPGPAAAEILLPDGTTGALTSWEDDEAYEEYEDEDDHHEGHDDDEHEEHESYRTSDGRLVRAEREHDDDD